MQLGYGTYGMPDVPLETALPRLAELGYETVELCANERYPAAPERLPAAGRREVRARLADLGLGLSGVMRFVNLLAPEGAELDRQIVLLRQACALARELSPAGAAPILISTLGSGPFTWEADLEPVADRVARFGGTAAAEGCRLALEPHVGGLLDRPSRAVTLLDRARARDGVDPAALALNFDISHFAVQGYPLEETVAALAPLALHTHVKDGRMEEGKVRFLLPGEGGFPYTDYLRAMARAGWGGPITVEITAQIFNRPGYDPWEAARFSLETLSRAREML